MTPLLKPKGLYLYVLLLVYWALTWDIFGIPSISISLLKADRLIGAEGDSMSSTINRVNEKSYDMARDGTV